MKKTLSLIMLFFAMATAANAQFGKGQGYVGASVSGLGISYNDSEKFKIDLNAQAGMFFWDDVLLYGQVGWKHIGEGDFNNFKLGAGGRYYIEQNGIFLGLSANYVYQSPSMNDFRPQVEVGYCFFISDQIAVEPALYYDQSFNDHSKFSTAGLKIGIGLYRNKDKVKNDIIDALK